MLIGGRGKDTIIDLNAGDSDSLFAQEEDLVTVNDESEVEIFEVYEPDGESQISIEGDNEFVDRTQSDFDTLAAIPEGAAVLESIDDNPEEHSVVIEQQVPGEGNKAVRETSRGVWEVDGEPGHNSDGTKHDEVGTNGTILYEPDKITLNSTTRPHEDWRDRPPIVALQHELLHTEDYVYGSLDPGQSEQVEHDGNGNAVTGPGGTDPAITVGADGNPVGESNNP